MKLTPKLQQGGNLSSLFTVYNPIQTPQMQMPQKIRTSNSDKESLTIRNSDKDTKDKDSDKGKLTEKELFSMIKDIDGLPNEMKSIISELKRSLATEQLIGVDTGSLSSAYLDSLYKLKIANQNKIRLDDSIKTAKQNGSLGEVAITLGGNLLAMGKDGRSHEITLQQYQSNPEAYKLLTNSNVAWLRKYSPKEAFNKNDDSFEIIDNGMGYESFQKLLDQAKIALGNYSYEEQGVAGKEALNGLKALQALPKDQRDQYIKNALDGVYTTKTTIDTNQQNINSLVDYLTASLPERAKVWATLKLQGSGIKDKNEATRTLVSQYLMGSAQNKSSYDVSYHGTKDSVKSKGTSGSGSGSSDQTKEGFWTQLQSGKAGDDQRNVTLIGKTQMSVNGKYYGTTPGMDANKSLQKYIADSNVGYLIQNTQNITFGDQQISPDSFKDVMVNAGGGAMVVTLPKTQDGKVNFGVIDTYTKVVNKLKEMNIEPNTEKYHKMEAAMLKKLGLGYLVNDRLGIPDTRYFGHYLVLEGVTSDKAYGTVGGKKQNIKEDKFLENVSSDDALFDTVRQALSSKETGEYKLDNNWISFNNDSLYKGNIYIPLNTNTLNGINADKNDVKASQSYKLEKDQQQFNKNQEKIDNLQNIDTQTLYQ